MPCVVIIEDELVLGRQLCRGLEASGHTVCLARTGAEGLDAVGSVEPDIVLLDLRLPDTSGLEVLPAILELDPALPVVLMTAYGSVDGAVEAMRKGAADYLQKPLDLEELRLTIDRVLSRQIEARELAYHRERVRAEASGVIGSSPQLLKIFEQIERLRSAELPPGRRPAILLTGETGTGKGVVARAIHEILGAGPFIDVNCTAIPAALIEAELFGHERGSFTGAASARTGLFEAAEGGAIFLDEIGHLELNSQTKFLKVIEERRVRRLGATRDRPVDVHVIAATNRDLDEAVAAGDFREDLLYRLRVLSFEIPPLRERVDDVPLLARHFCEDFSRVYGLPTRAPTEEGEALLTAYPWPGNVRELRNVIERAVLLNPDDQLGREIFAELLRSPRKSPGGSSFSLPAEGIDLGEIERQFIVQALERAEGNRTQAAELLGLSRDTLRYRLEKFGIS